MKKKGLGRGLSSLLKEDGFITDENLLTVDLDKLKAREDQPRKNFEQAEKCRFLDFWNGYEWNSVY